mgnify:CR=1 FL=1
MMKNRAVWVALLVLGVATLLMVFFVLPRVTPVKEEAAQAVSGAADTAKNAAATAETDIADAARTAGEKMGRLQAEATTAITAMKALFAEGRTPAADAFATAKGVAKAAVSALAALDVPTGIDASLDAAMKKARDNAVRALMLIDGLPDDPAKAAGLLAVIGVGKGHVGDHLIGVDTDPFMDWAVVFMELLHQQCFVTAAGKSPLQQGVDLGTVLWRYLLDFHALLL